MDGREFRSTIPTGGAGVPPASTPPRHNSSDSLSRYLEQSMDFDGLAGDIKTLVAERLQQSMPDDRRIILDLVSQMGALTDEVRLLRKQIETNTSEAYPVIDISSELAEIKQLIAANPTHKELEAPASTPIVLPLSAEVPQKPAESVGSVVHTEPAPAQETPTPETPAGPTPDADEPEQPAPAQEPATASGAGKRQDKKPKKEKKKKTAIGIVGDVLFYVVILGVVFGAFFLRMGSGGQPTMIAGYSGMTVLTSSMEDVYPKGSLIITQRVDADELQIGDDITYMISETSSITHRIIGITEDYLNTGERAFETQGTMNEKPDKDPVAAANVVGKVIFCSKPLGQAASFVTDNWPILLFSVVVLGVLFWFLKWNFSREEKEPARHARKRGQ